MFQRSLVPTLVKTAKTFPATLLTGPRQSGKTTLLKQLFPNYSYINLETPDTLLRIKDDPRGFLLAKKSQQWIIDETQHFPNYFLIYRKKLMRLHNLVASSCLAHKIFF